VHGVDLLGGGEVAAVRGRHRPVVHRLAVRPERVLLGRQPAADDAAQAGLLGHLADGGVQRVLAAVQLALGQ
jgi:hypothetical protein